MVYHFTVADLVFYSVENEEEHVCAIQRMLEGRETQNLQDALLQAVCNLPSFYVCLFI